MNGTGRFEQNIWRYEAFTALSFTPVMIPVVVLFWQANGLNLFDVFLLQAIFAMAVLVLEVPTGLVADRLGKRTSLLWGSGIEVAGMVTYGLGHGFGAFLAAELLLALGASLYSGAGAALLYDTLKALGREDTFQKRQGRAVAWQMGSFALCNLVGGVVGTYSYRATVWLSAIGPVAALVIALGFREVQARRRTDDWRAGLRSYRDLIGQSLRFVRKHQLVRWQVMFLGVLTGSGFWLLWLYQPYMTWSGLPVWAFGIAFALFNLFAGWMSHLAHRVERLFGREGTVYLLVGLQIVPLVLMAFVVTPVSFLFILGHQAVRGLAPPIISDRVLRYTFADKRATVLSIGSMAGRLFFALTAPVLGFLSERTSMPTTLLSQAGLLAALLGLLILSYRRIPAKYHEVKASVLEHQ